MARVLGILGIYILAITAIFAMLGLVAHSPEAANGYGFILLFLPYASSAFVSVSTMPNWLQGFAANQPITPVIESARVLLMGTSPRVGRRRRDHLVRRHNRGRDRLHRLPVPPPRHPLITGLAAPPGGRPTQAP